MICQLFTTGAFAPLGVGVSLNVTTICSACAAAALPSSANRSTGHGAGPPRLQLAGCVAGTLARRAGAADTAAETFARASIAILALPLASLGTSAS